MSLKGRGQGVELGTSIFSLIRCIFFSFFGLALPYEPLNIFPFFVFLSPRPQRIGASPSTAIDDVSEGDGRSAAITRLANAAHRCIIAIFCCLFCKIGSEPNCNEEGKRVWKYRVYLEKTWAGLLRSP